MKVTISFKHLEHTPALDKKINDKSSKFEKYFEGKGSIKWTCYVKDGYHYSEAHLYGPQFEYYAKAKSENLYKSFDMVVSKLEKQLDKKKNLVKNKLHRKREPLVILDPEQAWLQYDPYEQAS
jgi:putative sigma-54 modulation protein